MKDLNIKKCAKCGATVLVIEDCKCDSCGIQCCGEKMESVDPKSVDNEIKEIISTYEAK